MTATDTTVATQAFTIYVKATPAKIWDAITNGEQTARYGYACAVEYDLRPGGTYVVQANDGMREHGLSDVIIEGEVIEADAPHRLVQTWNPLFGSPVTEEPTTRMTWEISEAENGATKVTLTHELDGAPVTAGLVNGKDEMGGGGWPFVLSDLKTFLETGTSFAGS